MFVYGVAAPGVNYASSGSANTEDAWMAIREGGGGVRLQALHAVGKAAGATSLSGIGHHIRRWTTVGTGGTSLTPNPRHAQAPAAGTTAADKQTALTPGTVSGAVQLSIGHGVGGPGAWVARDDNSKITMEPDSADELAIYSISATVSLNFSGGVEIEEW